MNELSDEKSQNFPESTTLWLNSLLQFLLNKILSEKKSISGCKWN